MNEIKRFEPVFGQWTAESFIGADGCDRVYKVYRDTPEGREYRAVKLMAVPTREEIEQYRGRGMTDEMIIKLAGERLLDVNREIAIASRLGGLSGVMSYEDSATIERADEPGYDVLILMPYMESLEKLLQKRSLSRAETLRLGSEISEALKECAEAGIVHRNVKPGNIFLGSGGFVLGDLGSARIREDSSGFFRKTGAADYMAPEVFKGEHIGEEADVYSLGLIMYRMANGGRMPFMNVASDRDRAIYRRIAGSKLPAPAGADPELSDIIMKAVAYDPAERYKTAGEMNEAINALIEKERAERAAAAAQAAPEAPAEQAAQEAAPAAVPAAAAAAAAAAAPAETAPLAPEPEFEEPELSPREQKRLDKLRAAEEKEAARERALAEKDRLAFEKAEEKRRFREEKAAAKERERARRYEPDDYDDDEDEAPSGGRGVKAALIVTSIIACFALIGILGLLGKKAYDKYFGKGAYPDFSAMTPEIKQDKDDPDLYHVTVYAKRGSTLVYETPGGLRQEYEVPDDNRMVFNINGTSLIPNEPIDSSAYNAQPKIYIRESDGSLTPIPGMGYIALEVPPLEVELDRTEIVTEDGGVQVTGHIARTDAELIINGETVEIKGDGSFSYETVYTENGAYEMSVEARANRCQIYRDRVSVQVMIPEPPTIMLPWDLEDFTFSTRVTDPNDTISVYGTIPAGSSFSVSCENELVILSEPEVDEAGGFGFDATLPEIGDYLLILSCVGEDGRESTRELHLQRAPEWRPYVESAWAMSYDSLMRPSKQCYEIKGKIVEMLKHGDYYLAVLETSTGNRILLEYHNHYPSANTLIVGKEYSWIYGYSLGRDADGTPHVYVWFVNDR